MMLYCIFLVNQLIFFIIQSDIPDIITIRDFSKRDEGTYECQVRNYIGTDRARSTLALLGKLHILII